MSKGRLLKKAFAAIHDDMAVAMISLIILTAVDVISLNIFFLSIAVDVLTACQFIALGIVAVLFKVRARTRRQNIAWFFWASITFFGGLMFTLNTVIIQGDDAKPGYVRRAELDKQHAEESLDDLLAEQSSYRQANRRSIALEMEPSIEAARVSVKDAQEMLAVSISRWESEPKKKIRAIDIFARIPYVFKNPSAALYIAALFFIVLYSSVELSIFSIAGEIGAPQKTEKPRTRKLVLHDDRFEDLTDEDYRKAAELPDGSVRLPETVARRLKITLDEAEHKHAELYAGYIYRDGKYVKLGPSFEEGEA